MPQVTELIQLTGDEFNEYDASWSPDQSRIAYIKESQLKEFRELWVMNSNGENQIEVYQNYLLSHPDWGTGGILFVSWDLRPRDRHPNIWRMNNDLSDPYRLTMNKTDLKNPSWNKDSSRILTLWKNNYKYEIYTMDADASNLNRLTFLQTDVNSPSWSPDNSRIAYSYQNDIWIMNADATNLEKLTSNDYNETEPIWSPDGEWILFVSDENKDRDIWIMRSDGSEKTVLINNTKDQADPDLNNDGTKLLFTSYYDGNGDIWMAHLDFQKMDVASPTPPPTRSITEEEVAKEHMPRLAILGGGILITGVVFMVRRTIRGARRR